MQGSCGVESTFLKGKSFPFDTVWQLEGRWRSLTQGFSGRVRLLTPTQCISTTQKAVGKPNSPTHCSQLGAIDKLQVTHLSNLSLVFYAVLPVSGPMHPTYKCTENQGASEPLHWKNQEAWFHWSLAFFSSFVKRKRNNQKQYFLKFNFIPLVYYTAENEHRGSHFDGPEIENSGLQLTVIIRDISIQFHSQLLFCCWPSD